MSPMFPFSLDRRRIARWLAGVVLLAAVLVLAWPADARQSGAGVETLPDDLKLVPAETGAFITLRVADLINSEAGKKMMPVLRKSSVSILANLEKHVGVPVTTIERLTVLLPTRPDTEMTLIVRTRGAYDRAGVLGPRALEQKVAGKTVYQRASSEVVYLAGTNVFVVGGQHIVNIVKEKQKEAGPLAVALHRCAGKHHVVIAVLPEKVIRSRAEAGRKRPSLGELLDEMYPFYDDPYRPLCLAQLLIVTADAGSEIRLNAELSYADEDVAQDGVTASRTALYVARQRLQRLTRRETYLPPETTRVIADLSRRGQQSLKAAVVEREKTTVRGFVRFKVDAGILASTLASVHQHSLRQQAINTLKQIGVAAHNFASAYDGLLFAPAICDKDGKPLLSWRVAILPYLEYPGLYNEFKLDEAWDSPHNKKLLKRMPFNYAPAVGKTKEPYTTHYRVFTGPNALFDLKKVRPGPTSLSKGYNFGNIPDGSSNTIMVAEAAEAVPWTKPDELVYDEKKPLPKLGGQFPEGFLVLLADGSVRMLNKTISEKTMRNAINPNDGYALGSDW